MITAASSRALALGAVALVLAFAAAACGGSSTVATTETVSTSAATTAWANGVCTALTTWQNQMSKLAGSVTSSGRSPGALKATLKSAETITRTLGSTLLGLGKPQTNAGAQAKEKLTALADELAKDAAEIRKALDSVAAGGSISAAIATISSLASSMRNSTATTLKELQQLDVGGELQQAFSKAEACKALSG